MNYFYVIDCEKCFDFDFDRSSIKLLLHHLNFTSASVKHSNCHLKSCHCCCGSRSVANFLCSLSFIFAFTKLEQQKLQHLFARSYYLKSMQSSQENWRHYRRHLASQESIGSFEIKRMGSCCLNESGCFTGFALSKLRSIVLLSVTINCFKSCFILSKCWSFSFLTVI